MIGRAVALNLVVGRSDRAAVWISAVTVYPDGFEFEVEIRHRLEEEEFDDPFSRPFSRRRRRPLEEGLDPDLLRFGIQFSDGRKASNLGSGPPFARPGDPNTPPEGPVLLPNRGGGGGGGRWHQWFWVWPLPPEGPLAFVCEWPLADIPETRSEIDSALVRDAAAETLVLWPEDERRTGSGGWTSYGQMRAMPARPPLKPPEPADPD